MILPLLLSILVLLLWTLSLSPPTLPHGTRGAGRTTPQTQNPLVNVRADKTTSRDAILRFMTTVCLWRKVHDDLRGQLSLISTYDKDRRPVALDMLRATCSNKSKLLSFLEILTSVHLARNVDRRISTIAPEAIDTLFENRGLQEPSKDDIARFRPCARLGGLFRQISWGLQSFHNGSLKNYHIGRCPH